MEFDFFLREMLDKRYRDCVDKRYVGEDLQYVRQKSPRSVAVSFWTNGGRKSDIDQLDVFFIFPIRRFSYSYREIEQSLPKIYIVDNGLLTISGISEKGKLMENLVFVELLRRENEIYYYKSIDGKEVDFVVVEGKKVKELVQVSYSLDDMNTKEREIKALVKASEELRCKNLLIVTYDREGKEIIGKKMIKYVPLWKWLLKK